MPDLVAQRCRHVVAENERVLHSVAALRVGDVTAFGRDMDESHTSLRDLYAVSHPVLDTMVEVARAAAWLPGRASPAPGLAAAPSAWSSTPASPRWWMPCSEVARRTGLTPQIYLSGAEAGAGIILGE
ncbi:hypothetical protein [Candidatus Amarolinea dominans]|uniref:hypothetical protein n=1 Tax=Candidatus Amarolinea dominans TaxID=3140696 RepID=UPI0031CC3F20